MLPGGLEGPPQPVGERESGGRHGRRAVLLTIPALPEMTATQPQPQPLSPSTPPAQHMLGGQPQPEPLRKGEE